MFKAAFQKFLDFVLPARCLMCGRVLAGSDGVCADCFNTIDFVDEPKCAFCGRPFEFMPGRRGNPVCVKCLRSKPRFDSCVSAVIYSEGAKKIILPFKHGDKTNLAKFMAGVMVARGSGLIGKCNVIMPVPIHLFRMLKRKYNQAALLARFVGKSSGKPVFYNALVRKRSSPPQGHMGEKERIRNVKGVFAVKSRAKLKGLKVLLIDDVFTTGATVNECAAVLKKAGASRVYVLTFARA
jgi:ComF family protein